MITFQDYESRNGESVADFVLRAINNYQGGELYNNAVIADDYDHQRNTTIMRFLRTMYTASGRPVENKYASNNKIASNFFARLNTQRCTYSLGNGVSFAKEDIKDKFGAKFDTVLQSAGYYALIHGVSYLLLSDGVQHYFKATEFVPLFDEYTGALRAGIRFWRLAEDKPLIAVFYEENGYTKFAEGKDDSTFRKTEPMKPYIQRVSYTEAAGAEVIDEQNYSGLPIVPLWGSRLKQSTLVGLRGAIDSYDLIRSGFADDIMDCSEIYWIIENYGGMDNSDLARFLEKLKKQRIVEVNTDDGGRITPYTQEIPTASRKTFLDDIRSQIYEDFGGLDVHTMAAGSTNDHIDAAYQPLDENADDFEARIIECVQQIGVLLGINELDAIPLFKRNRISNQREQVEMITMEAVWLDEETILKKLPNITVDEVEDILKRKDAEDKDRLNSDDDDEANETDIVEVV